MARQSSYIYPTTVAFATSNRSNAKLKVKVFKTKSIDELLDKNFIVPGIPSKAIIKEVVVGKALSQKLIKKYNNK